MFSFLEPIFIFTENQWKEYPAFHFYYDSFESSHINFNPSINENDDCKIKIIRSSYSFETSFPLSEQKRKFFQIKLNHFFEFHHYTREEFIKVVENDDKKKMKKELPNYILELSINEDYIGRNRFFYGHSEIKDKSHHPNIYLIGCNFTREESRNEWQKLIEKLYLEFRYTEDGLMDQLYIRFTELMIKSFKDIVRFLWKIHTNNDQEKFSPTFLDLLKEFESKELKLKHFSKLNLRKEFQSIVYKCIISEGILPIYVDLNTMGNAASRWCRICCCKFLCCGIFLNDEVLPWSTQFHASFIVIDRYYSYTEKSRIHQKLLKDRLYSQASNYYRIKLLDFFPLDQWVILISDFLFEKFDEFIEQLSNKNHNNGISKIYDRYSELNEKLHPMKSYRCQETGSNEPFLVNTEKEARKRSKSSLIEYYKKFKDDKKNIKEPIFRIMIKAFNETEKNGKKLPELLAKSFISTYAFELTKTKILNNLCRLIAETEMRTYSLLDLNCQTVVGDFVQSIYQVMKKYIEILLPSKINESNYKDDIHYMNYFRKFASEIVNKEFMMPCSLNTRLDYFGIYADEFLKEKIDKLVSGPNIDCKNDAKISKIQKEFFKNYCAAFENFKNIRNENSLIEDNLFDKKDIKINRISSLFQNLQQEEEKLAISKITLQNSSINNLNNENEMLINTEKNEEFKIVENDKIMCMKDQNLLQISDCLPSLIFKVRLNLVEISKKITGYKYQKWGKKEIMPIAKLNKKKYENRDLLRELSYYYYNSIRLQQAKNEKKNFFSYIGDVIIKDPDAEIDSEEIIPNNFN